MVVFRRLLVAAGSVLTMAAGLGLVAVTPAGATTGTSRPVLGERHRSLPPPPNVPLRTFTPAETAAWATAGRASTVRRLPPALGKPAPAAAGDARFFWAQAGDQSFETESIHANMTIARPFLASADSHSLAEMYASFSNPWRNAVEVGWTVDRSLNGDDNPRLFVHHWVQGQATCYNGCGWVQHSDDLRPGMPLAVGPERLFVIQHYIDRWWVAYDTEWIGYFPDSLWNGVFTHTDEVKWYGEVATTGAGPVCTQMGNGLAGENERAATITEMGSYTNPAPHISFGSTSSRLYDEVPTSATGMRYGGPGEC